MKKNTIIPAIFLALMALTVLLFVLLFGKKDSIFWISLISTELSLLLLGGAASLYYSQRQFNKKVKDATLRYGIYYAAASAIINLLFGRFFSVKTGIYITIHVFLAILLGFAFFASVIFKRKKRHSRIKSKELSSSGIPSLLSEIQKIEGSVSKLNQEIQIDIESMLLSLDKEVRYVTIPEGDQGEDFQIYLKEKISELVPIMNQLIETQGEDTKPFAQKIIDLKYLLDNPEIAPPRAIPSPEVQEAPKSPDSKKIMNLIDLEKVSEEKKSSIFKSEKKSSESITPLKTDNIAKEIKMEDSPTLAEQKKELEENKKEKWSLFGKRKSKHPTEEELQVQLDEFFGRTTSKEKDAMLKTASENQNLEKETLISEENQEQPAFSFDETASDKSDENKITFSENSGEKSIADTFKEKISEIEDLAKNISSFEELERTPEKDVEGNEKKEE